MRKMKQGGLLSKFQIEQQININSSSLPSMPELHAITKYRPHMALQFSMQSWVSFPLLLLSALSREISQLSIYAFFQFFFDYHLKDQGHTGYGKLGLPSTPLPFNTAHNSTVVASLCCVRMFTLPLCHTPWCLLSQYHRTHSKCSCV